MSLLLPFLYQTFKLWLKPKFEPKALKKKSQTSRVCVSKKWIPLLLIHSGLRHSRQIKTHGNEGKASATPSWWCHPDTFTLTCCWGSGTSPPSWSWGHPQSEPRSHKEPRTESPLQQNNALHVEVRESRHEQYEWNFRRTCFTVGFSSSV